MTTMTEVLRLLDENKNILQVGRSEGNRIPQLVTGILHGCATGVLSPRLLLDMNKIPATIEGIGSVTSITEGFEEWVEIWKKGVMLEKGFWGMMVSLS